MTSDAKIGLLLGLIFIIITAFLINGLPSLLGKHGSGEIIRTTIASVNTNYTIDAQAEKAMRAFEKINSKAQPAVERVVLPENDPRFGGAASSFDVSEKKPDASKAVNKQVQRFTKSGISRNKTYIVMPGDNLGKIAMHVYGQEKGNTSEAVNRIYRANRNLLSSPDSLLVGQQLIIPDLSSPDLSSGVNAAGAPDNRSRKASQSVIQRAKQALLKAVNMSKPSRYTVREGDSLWSIAQIELGDGERCHEILNMNKDVIVNADDIQVGQHLKLPSR